LNEERIATSQAKIGIHGLWCTLNNSSTLSVSKSSSGINMSYIKGMLNNPDIQQELW